MEPTLQEKVMNEIHHLFRIFRERDGMTETEENENLIDTTRSKLRAIGKEAREYLENEDQEIKDAAKDAHKEIRRQTQAINDEIKADERELREEERAARKELKAEERAEHQAERELEREEHEAERAARKELKAEEKAEREMRRAERSWDEGGIGHTGCKLLSALDVKGPQNVAQLSDYFGKRFRRLQDRLPELEREGLIQSNANDQNRYSLTEAGRRKLAEMRRQRQDKSEQLLAGINAKDQQDLYDCLHRVCSQLKNQNDSTNYDAEWEEWIFIFDDSDDARQPQRTKSCGMGPGYRYEPRAEISE